MLISLIVTNGENFKEIEEPSLTALGDLDWNDPKINFHPPPKNSPVFRIMTTEGSRKNLFTPEQFAHNPKVLL